MHFVRLTAADTLNIYSMPGSRVAEGWGWTGRYKRGPRRQEMQ